MEKYKIIKDKDQKILKKLYESGIKVVIASVLDEIVEYPLFTEEGFVFDVEKGPLMVCKYCEIKYMPSGIYYGDNDSGIYEYYNNMEDNIKVPPYEGYYYLKPIQDGEIWEINKKHAAKKLAAYNKYFKNLKWVENKGGEDDGIKKLMKYIFNEN